MTADKRAAARKRRRLVPGQVPDPLRAHGAWVYLIVSILAGAAVTSPGRFAAILAGGAFAGVFVLTGSLAAANRRAAVARFLVGLALTMGSALLALVLQVDRSFLLVSLGAVPAALAAAWLAAGSGFLSPGALSLGVAALTVSAPVAATGGGASASTAVILFVVLAPFYIWRTWSVARVLGAGWTRPRLQRRGWLESGLAVTWAALAVVVVRLLG